MKNFWRHYLLFAGIATVCLGAYIFWAGIQPETETVPQAIYYSHMQKTVYKICGTIYTCVGWFLAAMWYYTRKD